ncbi:hypothetical protein B0H11DRAFT_1924399 [Mycena galericulata]|nr:hypothetical protein B0H11DRAFT_1924399 [Mycena galericulata]
MFYGDGRAGESPHNFKKRVMQKFMGKGMNDAEKIEALSLGMASGSLADAWFDDPARNTTDKTSWATISTAFDTKWPKRAALRRVGQDVIEDLLAEKLQVEDIGKQVTHGGVDEFGHVVWVCKLVRIAGDIPDPGGLFIGVVQEKLPMIMQDLLGPGTAFVDWAAFETAVVDIKQAAIVNAKPQRFAPQVYPPYPPYLRPQLPPPNAFAVLQQQQQAPVPPNAPPAYRPDAECLVNLLKNVPPHHPATDAGRAAYAQEISDWHARNGNRGPNEHRPYPLTPGETQPTPESRDA